jgi:hypothetical protein
LDHSDSIGITQFDDVEIAVGILYQRRGGSRTAPTQRNIWTSITNA